MPTRSGRSGRVRRSMNIIAAVSGIEMPRMRLKHTMNWNGDVSVPGIASVARQPRPLSTIHTTSGGSGSRIQASLRSGRLSSKAAMAARMAVASEA